MELEDVYRKDLNLLIALKVLVEEGSVSHAAVRLNLSQSALSRILGRLRDLLGDPLFIRHGQHLQPTQRAIELNLALNDPLQSLRTLLSPNDFEAINCTQHFNIAATDYALQTIMPYALPRIYKEAPNISLEFVPLKHKQMISQLTSEGVDIAICRPDYSIAPLQRDKLGLVSVFCMLSKSHPLADKTLTLENYLTYPHALIAISDGVKALLDATLSGHKKQNTVLRASYLKTALAIIDSMPLLITVPADLAYLVAEKYDLIVKPLPFEFKPFEYSLIWHPRYEYSPAQIWLRRVLKEECSQLIEQRIDDMGLG
ncbi:transcriptional regulator of LysR family protein [Psychromonas ingrahamii 37]|uniref:Transcriptional regulator of LysR family protein n=1 Tax=Psychromonas ingrahamii (strain DSM 17664 / CCUG 51855 / 37) TaxID=357804 RepID=A1STR0_PSYIN|nr:LysR family transcriptional regulator [Psychromonas ingrahamii]ABM02875.1 transcriptional regulator of LysR family protein [Psychromonas ingrahamii 37]